MNSRMLLTVGVAAAALKVAAAELPPLFGDGVHDDTAAIQARLDSGMSCVYLPPPAKEYLISRTLKLGSGQELRLDRFTVIRLAPGSDCAMLENRSFALGRTDSMLALTGGIWDHDNLRQSGNPMRIPEQQPLIPKTHTPEYFFGIGMRFNNVSNMTVRGVTVRNPTTYAIEFGHAAYVTVDDIIFDYTSWNPTRNNMDGIHLDGHSHHFRITNLRGTCYDDMVALNAHDGVCSPETGPITDIDIDGLYAGYSHSAVRMLSCGELVARVTIRNVHGNFYAYAIGLTHYFPEAPHGRFEDISVADVFLAKAQVPPDNWAPNRNRMPCIQVEGDVEVNRLSVERLVRVERELDAPTIGIAPESRVKRLVVRSSRGDNRLDRPIRFIDGRERIDCLVEDGNEFSGAWILDGEAAGAGTGK